MGFILGPRLNAAGRVGEPMEGLRLLLTDNWRRPPRSRARLEVLNTERQALDQQMLEEALTQVEQIADLERDASLVLAADAWHPGVVGIVASRVVERYGRPTFLIAFDGEIGKGDRAGASPASISTTPWSPCGDLLERFGGHHMAAGLTIRREHLEAFRERFDGIARGTLTPEDLGPEQRVDLEIGLHEMSYELERLCRHLEPCGTGNASPVFGVRGVRLAGRQRVGQGHLKGILDDGRHRLPAIGFQWADRVPWLTDDPVDVAFRLERTSGTGGRASRRGLRHRAARRRSSGATAAPCHPERSEGDMSRGTAPSLRSG